MPLVWGHTCPTQAGLNETLTCCCLATRVGHFLLTVCRSETEIVRDGGTLCYLCVKSGTGNSRVPLHHSSVNRYCVKYVRTLHFLFSFLRTQVGWKITPILKILSSPKNIMRFFLTNCPQFQLPFFLGMFTEDANVPTTARMKPLIQHTLHYGSSPKVSSPDLTKQLQLKLEFWHNH